MYVYVWNSALSFDELFSHFTCKNITNDHSFRYASPCFWNQLPVSLCQPHSSFSIPALFTSSFVNSLMFSSITPSLFQSGLTNLPVSLNLPTVDCRFTSSLRTASTDCYPGHYLWTTRFCFQFFPYTFFPFLVSCARFSRLFVSLLRHANISSRIIYVLSNVSIYVIDCNPKGMM